MNIKVASTTIVWLPKMQAISCANLIQKSLKYIILANEALILVTYNMSDIFDVIDRKLPEVRASVRRNLKRRLREGAVIASVRAGKLHLASANDSDRTILSVGVTEQMMSTKLTISRKPDISISEVKMFATEKTR